MEINFFHPKINMTDYKYLAIYMCPEQTLHISKYQLEVQKFKTFTFLLLPPPSSFFFSFKKEKRKRVSKHVVILS